MAREMFKELIPIRVKVHVIIKRCIFIASLHLEPPPPSQQMYMISVFWVSFRLAYDSLGRSCSEPRDRF